MSASVLPSITRNPRGFYLASLVLCGLAQVASLVGVGLLVRELIDSLGQLENAELLRSVGWISLLALLGASTRWLDRILSEQLGQSYSHDLRLALYDRLPQSQIRGVGVTTVHFVTDLNAIKRWISLGLSRLIVSGLSISGIIAILFYFDPIVSVTSLVTVLITLGSTFWIGRGLKQSIRNARHARGKLADHVADATQGVKSLIAFGRVGKHRARLSRLSRGVVEAMNSKAFWIGLLRALSESSCRILLVAAVGIAAWQTQSGEYGIGTLVAIVSIVGFLATPIRDLARVYEYWAGARIARDKLEARYSGETRPDAKTLPAGPLDIEVRAMALSPDSARISTNVRPGSKIALVGDNGSGKSTLLECIAGLTSPHCGRVLIGGVNATQLAPRSRSRCVGIAAGELGLLKGSIGKNIRMRVRKASQEAVDDICRDFDLTDIIRRLPDGLRTRVSSSHAALSDGEIARIKLARAFIGHPAVILLDEADAPLDEKGLQILADHIYGYEGTIIYATHNPQLIAAAHQVWTIDSGQLVVKKQSGGIFNLAAGDLSS